jgi:hypothetical protein
MNKSVFMSPVKFQKCQLQYFLRQCDELRWLGGKPKRMRTSPCKKVLIYQ